MILAGFALAYLCEEREVVGPGNPLEERAAVGNGRRIIQAS